MRGPPFILLACLLVTSGCRGGGPPPNAGSPQEAPREASAAAAAQAARDWAALLPLQYRLLADLTYQEIGGHALKLDLYLPAARPGPHPVVLHFHGGGWVRGTKDNQHLYLLPYLELGLAVVNATYRLGPGSPAPAAVDDARCALRWVAGHAGEHGLDPGRVVLTGFSAGGHLALATAAVPASVEVDRTCAWPEDPAPAAVVNWFGITDVADLLGGPGRKPFPEHWPYAEEWLTGVPNRRKVAAWVSPVTHVRGGFPPVLTIHGDADPLVPYRHATLLHRLLSEAGVPNELVTIPGGAHGGFSPDETLRAHAAIRSFLAQHGVLPETAPAEAFPPRVN